MIEKVGESAVIPISSSGPKLAPLLVALAAFALTLVAGCGAEQLQFDCVEHTHCLESEACIEGTCVDEPAVGDPCPSSHEGDEVRGLFCVDGVWSDELPSLVIQEVVATPELVIRGESVELEVIVDAQDKENLEYAWTAPEGWELADDDMARVVLVASDEFGVSATIEVEVRDAYGTSERGEVTVATEELFCGGQGSADDPWKVCTARFVNRVGVYEEHLGDHFELTTDVNMADLDGEEFNLIGDSNAPFVGVFDGGGHIIENLHIDSDRNEVGLFSRIGSDGVVRSVVIDGADVSGGERTGVLVGRNDGEVSQVAVSGVLSGDREVGGLAGRNGGTLVESRADVVVEGDDDAVGGLVGRNIGTITYAYALGDVEGVENVGGLVGDNGNVGTIDQTFSTGAVEGSLGVGGLVGGNSADAEAIEDSYWVVGSSGLDVSDGGMAIEAIRDLAYKRNFVANWQFYADEDFHWVMGEDESGVRPWLRWERSCETEECETGICDEGVQVCVRCLHENDDGNFGGGQGIDGDPLRICTEDQLRSVADAVADDPTATFALFDDILLDENWGTAQVIGTSAGNFFQGVFEGHGHRIEGLNLNQPNEDRMGLFGTIDAGGVVSNVVLKDAHVVGRNRVGGLAGYNSGTISGVSSVVDLVPGGGISGDEDVGGLVGVNAGVIDESYTTARVTGEDQVGGLVGRNDGGEINSSHHSGDVTGVVRVGGLVGYNTGGDIDSSHSSGVVTGVQDVGGLVGINGGIIGVETSTISSSHSTSDIKVTDGEGPQGGGGLVGINSGVGQIIDSYAVGEVEVFRYSGGLVGLNSGSIETSYASGNVICTGLCGGLVGQNFGSIVDAYSTGAIIFSPSDDENYAGGLIGFLLPFETAMIERAYSSGAVIPGGSTDPVMGALFGQVLGQNIECNSCFWDIENNSLNVTGGGEVSGATGQNTNWFGNGDNIPAGWDFENVWTIGIAPDGEMRPIFQWQ